MVAENPNQRWSIGVEVSYHGDGGWAARIKWNDRRFAKLGAVNGTIETTYIERTMSDAIDAILPIAAEFGVEWRSGVMGDDPRPCLYYGCDDEVSEDNLASDLKDAIREEAARRGWDCPFE